MATPLSDVAIAQTNTAGGVFFLAQGLTVAAGAALHILLDRRADRLTPHRIVELALIWLMAGTGVWAVLAGFSHIGPNSDAVAREIGFTQSMFQWEIGWADIGIGLLGLGTVWRRDGWLDAAVLMLAVSYGGDAIGHLAQYFAYGNTAGANVWAIPTDILQPLLAIGLLIAYRRGRPEAPQAKAATATLH